MKSRQRRKLSSELLDSRQLLAADLVALGPFDDAAFVAPSSDLTLEFSEDVRTGTGNVTIFNAGDDSVVEQISVDSGQVTVEGNTATINPSTDLPADAELYVQVDADAFIFETQTIYTEDFNGFEFDSFVSAQTSDTFTDLFDWTESLPAGWERDNTDTPEGGAIEYFGFNIFNKPSWVAEQGNQSRTTFTRGDGGVLVADPDAYDDSVEIDPNLFNVFVTTQEFDLTGLPENGLNFQFDNSFRWNDNMTGLVDVSFDGGATWQNLFTQGAPTGSPAIDSLDAANEQRQLDVPNPSSGTAKFRFGLENGSNDWWWAIDNVVVEVQSDTNADTFPGIESDAAWNFRTAPELATTPEQVSLTYAQDVSKTTGVGNITIRNAEDDSIVETIPATSDQVAIDGATVNVTPSTALEAGEYYLEVDESTIFAASTESSTINILTEDFDSLPLEFSPLFGNQNVDDYVVAMRGVLDVRVAGEYTFGTNSDDGQALWIDLDQDGLDTQDPSFDEIIIDNTTHGSQDRLSTCGIFSGSTSCEGNGDAGFDLAVGQYPFEYWYFERGGGSSGEFFYAPGDPDIFDPAIFALVGDDSQGIGVTDAGITATIYESTGTINTLEASRELISGVGLAQQNERIIPTADVYNSGGFGRFNDNHALPGYEPQVGEVHWSPEAPEGWNRTVMIPGTVAPEYHNGWTFIDKNAWIEEQGGQDRNTFTKGQNTLAIIDPDAADDFINIDPDQFGGTLETPNLDLTGLPANSIGLAYDSSFRWNDTMGGFVEVSFDDGNTWNELLALGNNGFEPPANDLVIANESVDLDISNPANGTAKFRWNLTQSGNDWWWAVDNIRVTAPFTGTALPGTSSAPSNLTFNVGGTTVNDGRTVGDLDESGSVDFADFLILSGNFGEAGSLADGDIDGSGQVDFADFLVLSGNFGRNVDEIFAEEAGGSGEPASLVATASANADDDVDAEIAAALQIEI